MLLPLALIDCDDKTTADEIAKCEKDREKMIVILMAMQANAPGSPMTSQQILPLLLMKGKFCTFACSNLEHQTINQTRS